MKRSITEALATTVSLLSTSVQIHDVNYNNIKYCNVFSPQYLIGSEDQFANVRGVAFFVFFLPITVQ